MFKINNRSIRWSFGVFIVNFEHNGHIVLVSFFCFLFFFADFKHVNGRLNIFCLKVIVNLVSYEKSGLIFALNTQFTMPCKKLLLFKCTFFVLQYHFCFYFTLDVIGVLFFLMVSCLHLNFQTK